MVTISREDLIKFMLFSERVSLPLNTVERKKVMQGFNGSCVVVKDLKKGYDVGELNVQRANYEHYSLVSNDKERQLFYSDLDMLFEPKLC